MENVLYQQILNLEEEIICDKNNLESYLKSDDVKGFEKTRHRLKTDLKYLSRIINGAPLGKKENKQVLGFLITNYNYLQKISNANKISQNYKNLK